MAAVTRPWWLQATDIYILSWFWRQKFNLSLTGQKSRCCQDVLPLEALEGGPSLASSGFWWLPAFFRFWPHPSDLCPCLHITFSSVCVSSRCLSLTRTLLTALGAQPDNAGSFPHLKVLNLVTSSKPIYFFPNKVTFTDSRGQSLIFWGPPFSPLVSILT